MATIRRVGSSRGAVPTGAWSWTYDGIGRVKTETGPQGTVGWTYYPSGNVWTQSDGSGTTTWTYDEAGNVRTESGPAGSRSWTYDLMGRVKTATDASGTASYGDDDLGNLEQYTGPDNASMSWTHVRTLPRHPADVAAADARRTLGPQAGAGVQTERRITRRWERSGPRRVTRCFSTSPRRACRSSPPLA